MLTRTSLDLDWHFRRLTHFGSVADAIAEARREADAWVSVELPHQPFAPDLDGRDHWLGLCVYRRVLPPADPALIAAGGRLRVAFGAAMHTAHLWLDDQPLGAHRGGYLPFEIDLTTALADGATHTLWVVLDNRDTPEVPPGKPYGEIDFCWYGGLYRDAELRAYPPVHITDPISADIPAGGGVFFRTLSASTEVAEVDVRTHVANTSASPRAVSVEVHLLCAEREVARAASRLITIAPGEHTHVQLGLRVHQPALWSTDDPRLHTLDVRVLNADGAVLDVRTERVGIRRLAFSRSRGFELNGRRLRLRGTNRHQEYPYCGYAVPASADRRDARRIKEAGFDYLRLAHYPQSRAFLEACDELGIVIMNPIPGWQFMGGEAFRDACRRNAREMIRRDRNHPCVVLWELSLNETAMDDAFMADLHAIGHEEYPGDQLFTCGWMDRYDVFTHSRQHGELHRWQNGEKALVVAEYGDWEFFASNHGFDQKTGAGLFASWSHGRQRRADGERGLRQQAWNHVIALNDTLSTVAALDGQWSIFDYARGYDPQRAACGLADLFRVPKFSWHFYRSQRHATADGGAAWSGGPVVFIASHWTPASDLQVLVFANTDEIELRLNGTVVARQRPAFAWMTQYLPHPPFVFHLPAFTPGTLEATGFIKGRPVAAHRVSTPGAITRIVLTSDAALLPAPLGEPEAVLVHAELRDARGTLCVEAATDVAFELSDPDGAQLLGPAMVAAEGGIASTTVRVPRAGTRFTLVARAVANPTTAPATPWTWLRAGLAHTTGNGTPAHPLRA